MNHPEINLHRAWGFQELAVRYCPYVRPHSATNQLRRWILHSHELQNKLSACHYTPGQKILTPRQVRCLVDHLGEP
ncbi:DUF4248 domain-containing protein [Parabacteroides sp. PF5-6]|uniref:DUF4248 domain-containing protein n=1 Tax=Parabacteroides sp. PF5-6 TaxID=1742403 RepID=UPI002404DB43|nr:DUF4248 domain-containing protein [Parabacteroides sp. PF5-6]MDF9830849.1 hypothetical protein [Parabacteroides sp. PF5-6]